MFEIYVPTYKKKHPRILALLKDNDIVLNLCVRQEEIDSGYYNDEQFQDERIHLISLGYAIKDIGETRQRILDYCKAHNVEFCTMFDDTVYEIRSKLYQSATPSTLLRLCVGALRMNPKKLPVALFGFTKAEMLKVDSLGNEAYFEIEQTQEYKEKYFAAFPAQAYILNMKYVYDIGYKNLNERGLEDTVFVCECLKRGYVFEFDSAIQYCAEEINTPKQGGNHIEHNSFEKVRDKYNLAQYKTFEHYKDMFGLSLEARYRNYLQGNVAFLNFDWAYYRELLVTKRKENQKIIDMNLSIKGYYNEFVKK